MMLENPSAFSAFKNIASLLPSVQNKMTHNALIKLLLDQGRTFNKTQDVFFENALTSWEKTLSQRHIPFDTLYRTDKTSHTPMDTWCFSYPTDVKIYFGAEHALSYYLLCALLGQTPTEQNTPTSFTETEQKILGSFYGLLVRSLPQIPSHTSAHITFNPPSLPTQLKPFFFNLKTHAHTFGFQLILSQPVSLQNQNQWRARLAEHIQSMDIPVRGILEQTLPLSAFLSLKKGDTLSFAPTADKTSVLIKTHQHNLVKGHLKPVSENASLQIETEAL